MKNLCLIGGGRWSRVLMSVLDQTLPQDWQIQWITHHGWDAAQYWCRTRSVQRIDVYRELSELQLSQAQAAVVATAPHTHFRTVRQLLERQIPTLCEKPLVLDASQGLELEKLAVDRNCPLGINLELTYASFAEQFQEKIANLTISQVEMTWQDPWSEIRHGETKYADVYTNIIEDMFPHCWSLIRLLTGGPPLLPGKVAYLENSDVRIELSQPQASISITLSRRAAKRVRKIRINGDEAVLDFSVEPGHIELHGQYEALQWRSARPLARSLQSFVDVVRLSNAWMDWPLAVNSCRESFLLSTELASCLWTSQREQLQRIKQMTGPATVDLRERLILDALLPLAARQGLRVDMQSPAEIHSFIQRMSQQIDQFLIDL